MHPGLIHMHRAELRTVSVVHDNDTNGHCTIRQLCYHDVDKNKFFCREELLVRCYRALLPDERTEKHTVRSGDLIEKK